MENLKDYKKAGEIAQKITAFARDLIKPGMPLVEIAKKIQDEIESHGAISAFPVNLSIDDVAAHYHPVIDDESVAKGLLKVDIGVHVNGYIADTAFSMDLSEDGRYGDLIDASEDALSEALKLVEGDVTLGEIGGKIQDVIRKKGFSSIVNLSGHSLERFEIHAGLTIPNYDNGNKNKLGEGAYAIEPFATTGEGKIYEGVSGNIYAVVSPKNTRSPIARKILDYVADKYETLPFSLREMQEEFGSMARLGIKELENQGIVHNFHQLIEKGHGVVSQAEHTFVKGKDRVVVTTRE